LAGLRASGKAPVAHDAIPPFVADSLALAVVVASDAPTLLLDGDFAVLAASSTFLRAFQTDLSAIQGRPVFALGGGASGMCRSFARCCGWP